MRHRLYLYAVALAAVAVAGLLATSPAQADPIRQYKAAMTKIFLWNYQAFPIFRQNPLFPGYLIRADNETPYLTTCYPNQTNGNYVETGGFTDGLAVSTKINAGLKGQVLSKRIAELELGGSMGFEKVSVITVLPLSIDPADPDGESLNDWDSSQAKCEIIGKWLRGEVGKYFLVEQVLHGQVQFQFRANFKAALDAAARSDVLKRIAHVFAINEADIGVSLTSASFAVARSPKPMTLAVVPARFSFEELARITNYLRGERGYKLEIAVNEALQAREAGVFTEARALIESVLDDEIGKREEWAERFVSGERMVSARLLRTEFSGQISPRDVANYAAAMVLISE